jgi:predicted methyltransferase MtxX (methanogen marker protein 4)
LPAAPIELGDGQGRDSEVVGQEDEGFAGDGIAIADAAERVRVIVLGELFVSGQLADAEVAVVTGDTLVEFAFGQEVEELGEDGATFVHKVKNRQSAVEHPQGVVAELKSKKGKTAKSSKYYKAEIVVRKILTGQQ